MTTDLAPASGAQSTFETLRPLPSSLIRTSSQISVWSLTVSGVVHVLRRPELMAQAMAELLDAVVAGELRVIVGGTYPLADARRAHEDLRARTTVGKLVLTP